jgi:hypothetical protein
MNTYFAFIPLVLLIAFLVLRNPSKAKSPQGRPDFIKKASEVIYADEKKVDSAQESDDSEYNYNVVGESFQRDHLMALIRAHDAFASGQIIATAVLEPEPTNDFDPTAVKVVVEGVQVGYIAKFDSGAVTAMIKKSGKETMQVGARIGFDPNSPAPLIGVQIALTVE